MFQAGDARERRDVRPLVRPFGSIPLQERRLQTGRRCRRHLSQPDLDSRPARLRSSSSVASPAAAASTTTIRR